MSKSVESTGGMKVLGRARYIKLNVNESIVDGNTVVAPFVAEYKGPRLTSIEYEWTDSKGVKRGLLLSGHGQLGVPTLREKELFIALQRIFIRKKTKDGVCEIKIENVTEEDLAIDFTMTELGRELGYKTMNKATRERIKNGIKILVATTVFNAHTGGIYDIVNKKYISDPNKAFHYIEATDGYTNDDGEDVTKIRISRFVYDTLAHSYNIFYNIAKIDQTTNLIAKNIYRLALQWKGEKNFACATIQTLVDRNPMEMNLLKHKKQQIKKALKILDDKKMLKIKYDNVNKEKAYMIFDDGEIDLENFEKEHDILKRFNTYKEIKDGLLDIGYTEDEVDNFDVEDISYIKALLRFYNINKKYKAIDYPKDYFDKCYKKRIILDDKYFNKKPS